MLACKNLRHACLGLVSVASLGLAQSAWAATVEVKMLNRDSDGNIMVFEPAFVRISPGDTVHFVATDKSHDVVSIAGMIPDGAAPFAGQINQDLTVTFDKAGIYAYRCKPHYGMGMVGLVVVGAPANEPAIKAALNTDVPNLAKARLTKLLTAMDGNKVVGEVETKTKNQ